MSSHRRQQDSRSNVSGRSCLEFTRDNYQAPLIVGKAEPGRMPRSPCQSHLSWCGRQKKPPSQFNRSLNHCGVIQVEVLAFWIYSYMDIIADIARVTRPSLREYTNIDSAKSSQYLRHLGRSVFFFLKPHWFLSKNHKRKHVIHHSFIHKNNPRQDCF